MTGPTPHASSSPPIGREAARHVLFHFGCGGYRPGSFIEQLIITIASADPMNRARLAMGFPEYTAAVALAQGPLDGIDQLQALAAVTPAEGRGW